VFKDLGFVQASNDLIKNPTKLKLFTQVNELMSAKRNIVLDNTNCTKEQRRPFIDLANNYKYVKIACILTANKDLCFHLDMLRKLTGEKSVGAIPIHTFFKNFESPDSSEFENIQTCVKVVHFVPVFNTKSSTKSSTGLELKKKLFESYLI
jgi:hypothetical protein